MEVIPESLDQQLVTKLYESSTSTSSLSFELHSYDIDVLTEHDWVAKTITLTDKQHIVIVQPKSECAIHILALSYASNTSLDRAIKKQHARAEVLHVFSNPLKASKTAVLCSMRLPNASPVFRVYSLVQISEQHTQLFILHATSIAELYNNLTDFESLIASLVINDTHKMPSIARHASISTIGSAMSQSVFQLPRLDSMHSINSTHLPYFASDRHPDSLEGIFWCSGTRYNINTLFLTRSGHITSSFPSPGHLTHFSGAQVEQIINLNVDIGGLIGTYTLIDRKIEISWLDVYQEDPLFLKQAVVVNENQLRFDGSETSDIFNRGLPFSLDTPYISGLFVSVLDQSAYIVLESNGSCQIALPQILDAFTADVGLILTYRIHYFTLEISCQFETQYFSICRTGIKNDLWIEGMIVVEMQQEEHVLTPEDAHDSYDLAATDWSIQTGNRPLSHSHSNHSLSQSQPPPNLFGLLPTSQTTLEGLYTNFQLNSHTPLLTLTFTASIPLVFGSVPHRGALSTTTSSSLQDIIKSMSPPQRALSGTYRMLITGMVQIAWRTIALAKECSWKPRQLVSLFKIVENGILFDSDVFETSSPLLLTKARAFHYSGACIAAMYSRNKLNTAEYLQFEMNGKVAITDTVTTLPVMPVMRRIFSSSLATLIERDLYTAWGILV